MKGSVAKSSFQKMFSHGYFFFFLIVLRAKIYYGKRENMQREKVYGAKSRANQVLVSKGPLQVKSHRM